MMVECVEKGFGTIEQARIATCENGRCLCGMGD
jgi:hypothetical protein